MSSGSLGRPIATGRTADIYAWGPDHILKLLKEGQSAEAVEYEARIARSVEAAGLAIPAVGEVVEVDGRPGLIYGRVYGESMLHRLEQRPWTLVASARLLAELQVEVHGRRVPELPSRRQRLQISIREAPALPSEMAEAVLKILDGLPDNDRLLHGDFHPDNVLFTEQGPVVIDWTDAAVGEPLADVARSSVLLSSASLPVRTPVDRLLVAGRRWFHGVYLRHYLRVSGVDHKHLVAWRTVVAAARMREQILDERERLVALIRAGITSATTQSREMGPG